MIYPVHLYGGPLDGETGHTDTPTFKFQGSIYIVSAAWSRYFGKTIAVPQGFKGRAPVNPLSPA